MKKHQHHTNTFEETLEKIEQIIECVDPDMTVRISDITGMAKVEQKNNAIISATKMLLNKYGINYKE